MDVEALQQVMVLDNKLVLVTNDRALSYDADAGQCLPVVSRDGQRLAHRVLLPTGIRLE
jgi:hypothetical protein